METVILEYALCLAENIIAFVLLNSLFYKRWGSNIPMVAAVIVCATAAYFCGDLLLPVRFGIGMIMCFACSMILYKGKTVIKAAYVLLFYYILCIQDVVIGTPVSALLDTGFLNAFFSVFIFRLVISLIIKAVNAVTMFFMYKGLRKIEHTFTDRYWGLFDIGIFVCLLVGMTFAMLYSQTDGDSSTGALFFILSLSFFIMSMIIIYLFTEICSGFRRDKKLYMLESGYSALQEKIALQNQSAEKLKKIRHDIKNHLINASTLIESGRTDRAAELLHKAADDVEKTTFQLEQTTGNDVADAIIISKSAVCESRNIVFRYQTEDLKNIQMDILDLSSLISNMIDNAIEAAEKTEAPFIELNIFKYNAYLAICVENSYLDNRIIKRTADRLASTKTDSLQHGYGSQIIKDIALKYNGEATWEADGRVFKTVVMVKV